VVVPASAPLLEEGCDSGRRRHRCLSRTHARARSQVGGDGEIEHRAGVTHVDGLRFQRKRKSHFVGGVGEDARLLAAWILGRRHQTLPTVAGRLALAGATASVA
jgi:hypothetical protein